MSAIEESLLRLTAVIVACGAAVLALRTIWAYVVKPFRQFAEAQPTLLSIADQFEPNSGSSLRDQIDMTNMRLQNIEQQLERVIMVCPAFDPWDGQTERRSDGAE